MSSCKDRKAIEEKALLCFKEYIVDSEVISQFIDENDKEPCWDGHIYLYSEPQKDKKHLIGRIPVQIKGTEVRRFISKKYHFKIGVDDLKAYLHEPTVYIVCQEKENSKERKLFYRRLLPETIKNILKGKEKQNSVSVLMHSVPESLIEFENLMKVFHGDSKKQLSFADKKSLTMDDARKRGINEFSFLMPTKIMSPIELMKYATTHTSFIYAKIDKDLDIEVPIADGPFSFKFRQDVKKEIAVNGKIFYDSYTNEIIDGKMIISINNFLILTLPLENKKEIKLEIKNHLNSLKSSIKEHDFLLAIHDAGELTINGFTIKLKINEKNNIEQIRQKVFQWKRLQKVLEILHVNKDLDLSSITEEQGQFIDILINTFLNKNSISIEKKENTILLQEISNVKLLMYIYTNSEGKGVLGDFFDHRIDIRYQVNASKTIKASPFSYLQNEDLWVKCDNIPYEMQISSYKNLGGDYEHIYELANLDLLSMIKAYDVVEKDDTHKKAQLLEAINNLDNWLLSTDKSDERHLIHTINHYQIIKRHRCYTEDEIDSIKSLYTNDEISMQIKVCLSLLLDDMQSFHTWYENCTDSEKTQLKSWPIWRFFGA
ncbi:MAG: hypothetical protein IKA75_02070 [Bacteroidaceae bacterium]|nr:hypothetical protein [Bacteroidaceae bacterium]